MSFFTSFKAWIITLCGLNIVVLVHEFGHFIACKFFSVATPIFSIGFGPKLIGIHIGNTLFQLALLPFGGYVAINEPELMAQSYGAQVIILMAGIVFNLIFSFVIFCILRSRHIEYQSLLSDIMKDFRGRFVGPIGIIQIIHRSVLSGWASYCAVLAMLSSSIAFFNMLPLPFLDGGQLLTYTARALMGSTPFSLGNYWETFILIMFFITFILLSLRDIKNSHHSE